METANIRKGTDLTIEWAIVAKDGTPYNLEGLDLSLFVRTAVSSRKKVSDFSVSGNKVTWTYYGKDQQIGRHTLTLVQNDGKEGMMTVDACELFNIVSCSCKAPEQIETDADGSIKMRYIGVTSEIVVGIKGDPFTYEDLTDEQKRDLASRGYVLLTLDTSGHTPTVSQDGHHNTYSLPADEDRASIYGGYVGDDKKLLDGARPLLVVFSNRAFSASLRVNNAGTLFIYGSLLSGEQTDVPAPLESEHITARLYSDGRVKLSFYNIDLLTEASASDILDKAKEHIKTGLESVAKGLEPIVVALGNNDAEYVTSMYNKIKKSQDGVFVLFSKTLYPVRADLQENIVSISWTTTGDGLLHFVYFINLYPDGKKSNMSIRQVQVAQEDSVDLASENALFSMAPRIKWIAKAGEEKCIQVLHPLIGDSNCEVVLMSKKWCGGIAGKRTRKTKSWHLLGETPIDLNELSDWFTDYNGLDISERILRSCLIPLNARIYDLTRNEYVHSPNKRAALFEDVDTAGWWDDVVQEFNGKYAGSYRMEYDMLTRKKKSVTFGIALRKPNPDYRGPQKEHNYHHNKVPNWLYSPVCPMKMWLSDNEKGVSFGFA